MCMTIGMERDSWFRLFLLVLLGDPDMPLQLT